MIVCDDVLAAVFVRGRLSADGDAHLVTCASCAAQAAAVRRAADALAAAATPAPPAGLTARVRLAAEPLLARAARRRTRRALAASIAIALVPLPAILLLDAALVRGAYALLSAVLPHALSVYLVSSYAAVLIVLLALTYAAIPILAERQLRAVGGPRV
jgi:hypothetical protein